jgi:hypothetical protein
MVTAQELENEMAQYTGSEAYHKLTLGHLLGTDGVAMVAQKAGAFWLVDAIASYQQEPKIKALAIQFWFLEVKDKKAELYCIEDKGKPKIVSQKIEYSDFPTGRWEFYVQNNIMMLTNEY